MKLRFLRSLLSVGLFLGLSWSALAQTNFVFVGPYRAHPTQILARYRNSPSSPVAKATLSALSLRVRHEFKELPGLVLLEAEPSRTGPQAVAPSADSQAERLADRIRALEASDLFRYVQPNYIYTNSLAPRDLSFSNGALWGLRNTGSGGGTRGSDIDAVRAWDLTTGSTNVIVAVIDSGIRYTHVDLQNQMWRNPGEIPGNGVDDDGNGWVDDVHGLNAVLSNGDPFDDNDHGTHVAGTIGAGANDGFAHVGVVWRVRLMACKFLAGEGFGRTADAIRCINYAVAHGAKILNNSWSGGPFDTALFDAIDNARSEGVLFVVAAGNDDNDNDSFPVYPASYQLDNVVAVAALDRRDLRASFSNFGLFAVHLGAPGVDIFSCAADSDTSYKTLDGTSMASPHVAGVAALVRSLHPNAPLAEVRQRLLATTVPVADIKGKTTTGGRVNAYQALSAKGDGILEMSVDPAPNTDILGNQPYAFFVTITDLFSVTNATLTATVEGLPDIVTFRNDGLDPDDTKGDAVYAAYLNIPKTITSLTMDFTAVAPDKEEFRQRVTYPVLQQPENDAFATALVLPPEGTIVYATNKAASVEQDEPRHANLFFASRSLWWNWTPQRSGPVIIDTAGSSFDIVLAVYTNSTLRALRAVASADNIPSPDPIRPPRLQPYVQFPASAGVAYRIAVAGADPFSAGTIRLRVEFGGESDVQAPIVTITSPLSGSVVTHANDNKIIITGQTLDPQPNGSGVKEVLVQVNEDVAKSAIGLTNWTSTAFLEIGENRVRVVGTDFAGNSSSPRPLTILYRPLLSPNDLFSRASAIMGTEGLVAGNNSQGTKEAGEPAHADVGAGKSVWWVYEAPVDGVLTLATTNATFTTVLAVYQGDQVSQLTALASGAATEESSPNIKITTLVRAQQRYRIAVDSAHAASGAFELSYSLKQGAVYNLSVTAGEGGTVTPTGGVFPGGEVVLVEAQAAANFEFERWEGTINSTENPLEVVMNRSITLTARFRAKGHTDDFETGNFSKLPWVNTSQPPWTVQGGAGQAGRFAARSGAIGNGRNTSLRVTQFCRAGTGRFSLRVSSEETWDTLSFLINNNRVGRWSGEVGWIDFEFPVPTGTNTFEWRYAKDVANTAAGLDAAFIDNLDLPLAVPINATTPARLSFERTTAGRFQLRGTGQADQTYTIQSSEDLRTWITESTTVATGGVLRYLEPAGRATGHRFYRAIVP